MSDRTSRAPDPAPGSCSMQSESVDEPADGTAPRARAWLALEQTGPWGAKAFTQSHLNPETGRALERTCDKAGVRPCLIRRPGSHADAGAAAPRRVLLAQTAPGASWLAEGDVDDPRALLDIDLAAAAAGDLAATLASAPYLRRSDESHLLVCTNGTRDVCCAVRGRPVALAAAQRLPGQVWEVTHTSGHRFAPTSVLLPSGYLHGRLDTGTAVAVLEAAQRGRLSLDGCRGRSFLSPEAQVAELAVRRATGEVALDALRVSRQDDTRWRVTHSDGTRWSVSVASAPPGAERPESCGKSAVPVRAYVATDLRAD